MEFSYQLSADDHVEAYRLANRPSYKRTFRSDLMLWGTLFVCVFLAVAAIQKWAPQPSTPSERGDKAPQQIAAQVNSPFMPGMLSVFVQIAVFGAMALVLKIATSRYPIYAIRRRYRLDEEMRRPVAAVITDKEGILISQSSGSALMEWSEFKSWKENQSLTLVINKLKGYLILKVDGLPPEQREELRGILTHALPKR